jgi:putative nucleotidyltransferase with HDIG domain
MTEALERQVAGGRAVDEYMSRAGDDGDVTYRVLGVPIATPHNGLTVGVIALYVSDLRRAEEDARRTAERLRRTLEGSVLAMSQVVETRDPYTAGHERRVAELATAMAEELGWEGDQLAGLRLGGLIHDIGKIAVPAEILSKPGRLSEAEFNLIKQHSQAGCDILASIEFDRPVAEMVRQHHERLDGSGYPLGLRAGQILPEAKILAVADVVEAMSSHRPYRPALGMEPALDEVRTGAGVRYDREVADACLRLVREKAFSFSS